ncbi:acetyl-CoA carboxylase biotin carboxyl carrier protein subunit [Hydrogenophaga sp. A37]|uniref:acetyl-CoA carboxylase biotin carboxyl carrier protein subunit n=1 Tax=Hydrogenophaga sp. A37 TaxID=1945864 RepID=UPI000985796A|nr:acetyl-CoA carboxylase biotin carboxyl carrier protein subunit [Hydrogenophaga sp. A37]OOG81152.1 hypothetical protein B0E41_18610 [Hydrogenophaga sp. A37]
MLVIVEAMKMEHERRADTDGVVVELSCAAGETVRGAGCLKTGREQSRSAGCGLSIGLCDSHTPPSAGYGPFRRVRRRPWRERPRWATGERSG